jgi:hypothetical protein
MPPKVHLGAGEKLSSGNPQDYFFLNRAMLINSGQFQQTRKKEFVIQKTLSDLIRVAKVASQPPQRQTLFSMEK